MRKEAFRHLWPAALLLMLTAAGAMALVASSARFHATQEEAMESTRSGLSQLHTQLAGLRQDEQEIRNQMALVDRMRARGILGNEDRLQWMEQLRRIKREYGLYDLEYEIPPQGILAPAAATTAAGRFRFYSSRMALRMDLLHEGDLLVLLAEFGRSARAHVRTTRCTIDRLPQTTQGPSPAAQLRAECQLELITARQQAEKRQ